MLHKHLTHFKFFFHYLGGKMFISLGIVLVIGMLDALGLTMFLPLLQMVSEAGVVGENMGSLSFLVTFIEGLGSALTLKTALFFMLLFFSLKGVVKYYGEVYNATVYQSFIRKIRFNILDSLNHASYKYFVTSDVGRIQNTMTGEVDRVASSYYSYAKFFQNAIFVVVYMGFAFMVDWQFAILIAIGGGCTHYFFALVYKSTEGASHDLTNYYHTYEGAVIQHVANYKYLKATGLIQPFADRLKNSIRQIEESINQMSFLGAKLNAMREPVLMVVVAVVLIIHIQFLQGNLGNLLISLLFFYRALTSLSSMQSSWNNFLAVSGSLENMKSFQKELDDNMERNTSIKKPTFNHAITLKEVSFYYGATGILHDINLTITKNEAVAFVGESGCGKTNLVNLISGLLRPDKGEIKVDELSYESMELSAFQKRIGYVTQEPVIFNDTIYNNVSFWAPKTEANMHRFQVAVERASIDSFINTLEAKEQSLLGNSGINLSGGQKQRISIARELFKDIDILIMDEATSSLDSETEKLIQNQIEKLRGSYTILIIAHRLSTIKNVDRVILMESGRIIDIATYYDLSTHNVNFKKMISTQEL